MKFRFLFILFFGVGVFAQQLDDTNAIEVNFLRGNILPHSPELYHLITGHPEGIMLSFSRKTYGKEAWQSLYNYPDYGGYFIYQDFKNEMLGKNYAVGAHYNFYFLKRHLMFKIGQGLAMTTRAYDRETNSKNRAFGSKYMGNTNFMLNYRKDRIIGSLGIDAGFFFTHYSNGRFKSPNSGINTYGLNLGVHYDFEKQPQYVVLDSVASSMKYSESIKFNLVLRSGFNESYVIGSGQKPFYHFGAYADKRLNRKSAIQAGFDLFATTSIKEFIRYRSIAYPEEHLDPNTDYKRVGFFIGHELFINRLSIETQLGYYIYRPFELDTPIYDRLGMKYYWYKNVYSALSVKTHGFLAEALELGIGIRI
ncbi:acyloxyacyl hydrolase [Flavobacterium sp. CYK-4]|uniref:acyloxyacyl hydrolase n=1 Tax=Flavobacterium lotistagni TaxID=2709660 RepID=UPI00140C67F4|nr:acyloxyacyl hydrolase [Flavobacterium lotistagni]NHM08111.1 acyloxyacyl hydrolase [Flavobacterium lotistagni]